MLPARNRLRASTMFGQVRRAGQRGTSQAVVVHLLPRDAQVPTQVGFAVPKTVGNAVVRHRVTRQLRALMAERLGTLPAGAAVVVRALPWAATVPIDQLSAEVDLALQRASR